MTLPETERRCYGIYIIMGNKNTERKKRNKQNRKQRKNQSNERLKHAGNTTKNDLIHIEAENAQGFADLLECGDK
jgi:hypothetical protein